jgi:uncharacterized protein (TIGR00369 family)
MDGGDTVQTWVRRPVTEGEWAGWTVWGDDPFEMLAGPFFCRKADDGAMVCAFRAEAKHMNGSGFMHGGCLLTFADYALFCIGADALEGTGSVTASLHGDFIEGASVGEFIEGSGEVVRAGGSLVFIRGVITTGGRTLMSFSGIVKKVRARR